mmetsp:Transcript_25957/g.24810  ORF Transcript_25957/g.24810 Transcript_25957/m.24810 type:complete len:294 (+) Transcript_25957:145-1026(+)
MNYSSILVCLLALLVQLDTFESFKAIGRVNFRTSFSIKSSESDMDGKRGMKGYYRRPSRAIEKGGGFFIPGLEGEKIRVLSAAVLILAIASNRAGVQDATAAQITSEVIGVVMAVILFVQGLAEAFPSVGSSQSIANAAPLSSFLSVIQSAPKSSQIDAVESAARSIIQTCEDISYILIVSNIDKKVILELGPVTGNAATEDSAKVLSGFSNRNIDRESELKSTPLLSMFQPSSSFLARNSNSPFLILPEKVSSVAVIVDGKNDWTWLIATAAELAEFNESAEWINSLTSAPF